ncbi:MAG TPA: SIS domain-containing protein [Acidimicrobiales bacterium]|nr:SIS domain-containing protein [Acidimicrobiales bacterium]
MIRRPSRRQPPGLPSLCETLGTALEHLESALTADDPGTTLAAAADELEAVDCSMRGAAGVVALLGDASGAERIAELAAQVDRAVAELDVTLDAGDHAIEGQRLEHVNAGLLRAKDAAWALRHDRLRTAAAVADLAGPGAGPAAIEGYTSMQLALSAIDRLEVRGRDSAGIHVLVDGHGLDLEDGEVKARLTERDDPLFRSTAVRTPLGHLSIVYKAAAEIGELGDNTAALRAQIRDDELLRRALAGDDARLTLLGHTRWASVGIISEANAHPLNSEEEGGAGAGAASYVTAALNGDVDNHVELRQREGLAISEEVTTDAKVIPALVARARQGGDGIDEAVRHTVASFDGSVAIGVSAAEAPGTLHLALRGSGQALYVGLAEDAYVVASEPYGLVEETSRYVRMDGETPSGVDGSRGQILVLDGSLAGDLDGIRRLAYDGTTLPLADDDVHTAGITTRDIDRGGAPHFLLKEIGEAPRSIRKTLRGRITDDSGTATLALGDDVLPTQIRDRLAAGGIRRIVVTGQGTAAVAGQGMAAVLAGMLDGADLRVVAMPATELSGFALRDDMADTLVVAISQSGTTTDTNRTVDLVRARGAAVLAIVNRRNSDLVERADGVLYTSDGRDVEMAVPSTKAFYAQIAAGVLLAVGIAGAAGLGDRRRDASLLDALRGLPDAMEATLALRPEIAEAAQRYTPSRRYWAIVGNGLDRIAAEEVRIKLSELCYKSISCDATEDKKHIDLSAEPFILVCAAGLRGANADDVAKEVAIYRAHKAAPVVIATEGEGVFSAALQVIEVPSVHPALSFVLSAMVGHLFGYEAALAIDAQALPLREARAAVEEALAGGGLGDHPLERLAPSLVDPAGRFFAGLREGAYDGHLEASTAVRVTSLLRVATGLVPLDAYELEHGLVSSPAVLVEELVAGLTRGVEELTRPIDAIKHQAKTVTVGISRAEDTFLDVPLVRELLGVGVPRDRVGYRSVRTLAAVDPAVAEVTGYTRYRVAGDVAQRRATISVIDKGGSAASLASRADVEDQLRGTKHRVASERQVTVARGARDGRTIVMAPEVKDNEVTGITLLHVRFHDRLEPDVARQVLTGYRGRYSALVDAVTETEPTFDDSLLGEIDIIDLLVEPVHVLAGRWRRNRT